jgi:hypothetical protein
MNTGKTHSMMGEIGNTDGETTEQVSLFSKYDYFSSLIVAATFRWICEV